MQHSPATVHSSNGSVSHGPGNEMKTQMTCTMLPQRHAPPFLQRQLTSHGEGQDSYTQFYLVAVRLLCLVETEHWSQKSPPLCANVRSGESSHTSVSGLPGDAIDVFFTGPLPADMQTYSSLVLSNYVPENLMNSYHKFIQFILQQSM